MKKSEKRKLGRKGKVEKKENEDFCYRRLERNLREMQHFFFVCLFIYIFSYLFVFVFCIIIKLENVFSLYKRD